MRIKIPDKISKRGVLHLGYACNLKCPFCYYRDVSNRQFMILGAIKRIVKSFKQYYDIKQIDYTGGEPTLYKDLDPLLKWTKEQGIVPTVITHGMFMDKVKETCEFLVSVHDVGERADKLVGHQGFFEEQKKQIKKLKVRYRTNTTVYKDNYRYLEETAKYLITTKTSVHNFIMFNPFISESNFDKIFVEFKEIRPYLENAINILEDAGRKVNVRYMPFCALPKHHKNIVDWHQIQKDKDEWVYLAWHQKPEENFFDPYTWWTKKEEDYALLQLNAAKRKIVYDEISEASFLEWGFRQSKHLNYKKNEQCKRCGLNDICDGFAGNYVKVFGDHEIEPIVINPPIVDVNYYRDQYENISGHT